MNPIQKAIYALNQIPNTKNVGPNGESSYAIVSELERYVRDNPVAQTGDSKAVETNKVQPERDINIPKCSCYRYRCVCQ